MTSKLFNEYGHYIGPEFPADCVADCSASGQVYDAVHLWALELEFSVPRDLAIRYLREYGAWTAEELAEKTDTQLAETVLWIACGDISEQGEWMGICS